jgi:glycosidase
VPASPTPLPEPTKTPLPASPTPAPRAAAWWDQATFYEIFVRSFYDSDGDGIGDLPGVIEKLDYLNDGDPTTGTDLGVTGLWLMPIFPAVSYHGYDVTDYYSVNPQYGTAEDFKRLVAEAHRRGIQVIVDMVLNHTSDQHPWFLDSASAPSAEHRDWYIWSESNPGYVGPTSQTVWHPKNGAYYYGLFGSGMPDLNLENPEVTAELYKAARFWLEDMGADGFRLDAAQHYVENGKKQVGTPATHAWLRDYRAYCKEAKSQPPEMLTVGEVMSISDAVATYVPQDLDLAFEFSLAKSVLLSVNEASSTALASAMKEIQRLYPEGGYAPFLTNHDQNRVMDVLGRDPGKAKLAATILLTLPGVPFVYYGEEIGMTGSKSHELIRTPMQWTPGASAGFTTGQPWEPVNAGYEQSNVETEMADPGSLLNHYRKLIAVRNAHPALQGYGFAALQSADTAAYAYLRQGGEETILVALNLGEEPVGEYGLSVSASSLTPGRYTAVDLLSGAEAAALTVGAGGAIDKYQPLPELPARSALILQLVAAGE